MGILIKNKVKLGNVFKRIYNVDYWNENGMVKRDLNHCCRNSLKSRSWQGFPKPS